MNIFRQKKAVIKKCRALFYSSVGALVLGLLPQLSAAQTKVVGYIPAAKNMTAVINRTDLGKLTHINLSFANPTASGAFMNGGNPLCMWDSNEINIAGSEINYVVQRAQQAGVKVLISVAGGVIPGCSGNWATLLQPGNRQNTVNNLLQFVSYYNLDGLDIDIEGALLDGIDRAGNYTPFIQALRQGLPAGKLLTSATASYVGGMVPTSSLQYFDFVNIMSYDSVGPGWGTPGIEHSSYSQAQAHINTWKQRGLPKNKMVLGVPFYGYGFNGYSTDYTFADIVRIYGAAAAQTDVVGDVCVGCGYITYNGIPTIRSKTRLALQEGSGVMIWELSQDGVGAYSLLSAISGEIGQGGSSSSSSSSSTGSGNCAAWVEGRQYFAGDVVSYQGGYYIAEYDNPGYTPTISPYYWEPVSASSCGTSSVSSSSSSRSSSSTPAACPNWVEGMQYSVGTVVLYLGNYYIAEYANPGYIPTVSTYYWEPVSASACGGVASSSSSSSSTAAFSRLIQAESYSAMSGVELENTSDTNLGQNVGWIDAGDWMSYANIAIPSAGTYRVEYRVASVGGSVLSLDLNAGQTQLGQVNVPATGDWQAWATVSHNVQLSAGTFSVGVYAQQGGWNINWFRITKL